MTARAELPGAAVRCIPLSVAGPGGRTNNGLVATVSRGMARMAGPGGHISGYPVATVSRGTPMTARAGIPGATAGCVRRLWLALALVRGKGGGEQAAKTDGLVF